jgi:hypothetical protein
MFEALRAAQLGIWSGIVVLAAWRLGVMHRGVAGGAVARRLRDASPGTVARALRACAPSAFAAYAEAAEHRDPDEAELELREIELRVEREVVRGLAAVRVLGLAASALGFVVVADQIAWLGEDHGLLDLDPVRVGRLASERAAVGLALAIGASGTAVGAATVLRARARTMLQDAGAVRELIERLRARWTDEAPRC